MSALFPRWSNALFGLVLGVGVAGLSAAIAAPMIYVRTPYGTHQYQPLEQPVEFDHRHHVRDDGITCLYCHTGAAHEKHAGVPATSVCMGCHNQIWPEGTLLELVRSSYFSGIPIPWRRIHALPDFVYFHHGVHTQAGVACSRCHGAVEDMPRVFRVSPLTMEWCLDCHRNPPVKDLPAQRDTVTRLTTCTACHR